MGARLKALRETLGHTQAVLADVMDVGVTTVSAYETGQNPIGVLELERAARVFGFTTDYVILGDMSGLRFDLALKLQARERAAAGAEPGPKRGRPRQAPSLADFPPLPRGGPPLLRDAPATGTPIDRSRLHEEQAGFVPRK
jgi:transcriptional regulator with XRE-family HTH domain